MWTVTPAQVLTEQTCCRDARSCSEASGMEVAGGAHLLDLGRDICAGIFPARAACAYERLRAPGTSRGMMLSCPPQLDFIQLCSVPSNSSTPSSSCRLDSTRSTCSRLSVCPPHRIHFPRHCSNSWTHPAINSASRSVASSGKEAEGG
jgi:hypothetical protein